MSTNQLSNLSYTNKDFNSIYTELLEYAKKLSYKWDPSASDESDPGVVLLKLAALIGDKDNYNIDKNILELMPVSVTQLPAARQIFDQCGYAMRYYRAAEGDVNLTIKSDLGNDLSEKSDSEFSYKIPQFTMFTDSDSNVVYTSKEAVTIPIKTEWPIPVIEGTIVHYTVNNDPLITIQNLDSNNRLYFTETNIAENGIFITNVDESNYEEWHRVDNLQTQPNGARVYKFGITIDSSVCYIEFPEDVEFLIGQGINVSYILTSGSTGNIAANKLRQFYADTKFLRSSDSEKSVEVPATADKVVIKNTLPILNGEDPESIDSAYKNYKRVRDTFDTLVSLKDYTDYLVTSQTASNGYVCDRTNDIQNSYKVLTSNENSTYQKTMIESQTYFQKTDINSDFEEIDKPNMSAFDLCVYALQYIPVVSSDAEFKKSFEIFDFSEDTSYGESSLQRAGVKSLQHNFISFKENKILMLKNRYPIVAHIIPRYALSSIEKFQVIQNIETALCRVLNSNNITFGTPPSINVIQQAILDADERIKTISDFASPKYETYAVYKNTEGEFKELRIDHDSLDGGYVKVSLTQKSFKNEDKTSLFIYDVKTDSFKTLGDDPLYDSSETYYKYDSDLSNLWNSFRVEVFAKNVLAGITPLYTDDNTYTTGINQTNVQEYNPIVKLSTNTSIKVNAGNTNASDVATSWKSEVLRDNEQLLLTAPNFVKENNFSSYVKILYVFNKDTKDIIPDGSNYELKDDEFIMFFWKDTDSSQSYSYIKYDSTSNSPAKFVSPSGFNLPIEQILTSTSFSSDSYFYKTDIKAFFGDNARFPVGRGSTYNLSYDGPNPLVKKDNIEIRSATEFVEKCLKSDSNLQVLTGTKIINMNNINKIQINNTKNGCKYVSWILNKSTVDNKYVLFDKGVTSYTLRSGEYLLYTNDEKTMLHLLGEGTLIERSSDWLTTINQNEWAIPAISYETVLIEGIDSIQWYTLSLRDDSYQLWATEQQQILIGPDNSLQLSSSTSSLLHCGKPIVIPESYTTDCDITVTFKSNNKSYTGINIGQDELDSSKKFILYKYDEDKYDIVSTEDGEEQFILPKYRNIIVDKDDYEILANYFKNILKTDVDPICVIDSETPVNLSDFNISYVDNKNVVTTVTPIEAESASWSVLSILNVNMSSDSPQCLLEGQSIGVCEDDDSTTYEIIQGHVQTSDQDNNNYYVPKYVQCNKALNILGGSDIEIESLFGSDIKMIAYESAEQPNIEFDNYPNVEYYDSTNSVVINIPSTQLEKGSQVLYPVQNILPGNYLLEVSASKAIEGLTLSCSSDKGDILSRIQSSNTYKLTIPAECNFTLTVHWKGATKNAAIVIKPLFKYTNELLSGIKTSITDKTFEDQLLNKISELDKESIFSYSYKPATPIKNPLIAEEFLKNNHFYNKYTICEWDVDVANTISVRDVIR